MMRIIKPYGRHTEINTDSSYQLDKEAEMPAAHRSSTFIMSCLQQKIFTY